MILKIQAGISGADLGYLLHKNPSRLHSVELPFGNAYIFYPTLGDKEAEAALAVEVDPVGLVRGSGKPGAEGSMDQYVNDRPYVASSFLSVAMAKALGTAMSGRSKERQALADQALQWQATIGVVNCHGGEEMLRSLFEPLGYAVSAKQFPLDEQFPEWGEGHYYALSIEGNVRLQDLLTHIYVLIPTLDAEKHYWVGTPEVEKLLRKGEGWLAQHPQKETIARRYLNFDRNLTRAALARLVEDEEIDPESAAAIREQAEQKLEQPMRLWEQRMDAVVAVLREIGATSVVDLGCGEGKLIRQLLEEKQFERIVGMDVSYRSLETAQRRLRLEQMAPRQRERVNLIHGSLVYADTRLKGFDAATVVEVIEHLDAARLAAFERVVFEQAQPRAVIVTTPNADYNVKFPSLPAGQFRHADHRFEWTRSQFEDWARGVAGRFGYQVRYLPVGVEDEVVGAPTQMGVFSR